MAGAPGTHVPLGQFHSGGHLATGPNWRQAAAATSLADRAFILEEYDPVAGSWASKGVRIDVSCGRIGVPFQVTNDDKVYVITLRTATEGTAAIGAEEVDIRLAPAVPSESLSASAASPMPDEIDTDDLMVAVRAAGDGAGAEGGTTPCCASSPCCGRWRGHDHPPSVDPGAFRGSHGPIGAATASAVFAGILFTGRCGEPAGSGPLPRLVRGPAK